MGAALGAGLVAFAALAGLFIRDLILSGQTCTALGGTGPAVSVLFDACMGRVQGGARRLWRWRGRVEGTYGWRGRRILVGGGDVVEGT